MLRAWKRDQRGIALTEFALSLPMFVTLIYGVTDVTRFILISQKTEKLAHTVAQVTAQSATITRATLDQVFAAASDIMTPYTVGSNGHIFVTSIYRAPGNANATVNWRYDGGGTLTAASALGTVNGAPNLPSGFTLSERENVIVAEVYYRFSPLLTNPFFGTTTIYRTAYYTPRFGALITAPA